MSLAADVLVAVDNVEKHWDETSGLQALTMEVRGRGAGRGARTLRHRQEHPPRDDRRVVPTRPRHDHLGPCLRGL